jgi:hypothetical protein
MTSTTITTHDCPGRCGDSTIPQRSFACRSCWSRLPIEHRDAIKDAYSRRHAEGPIPHIRAMSHARGWYRDNPIAPIAASAS